ncbi:MAG: hypothetical protein BIFFINMI_00659 [Phycisphaerae bacterium]|nr:hypothetical protein [Phycisphaerae bacterium]
MIDRLRFAIVVVIVFALGPVAYGEEKLAVKAAPPATQGAESLRPSTYPDTPRTSPAELIERRDNGSLLISIQPRPYVETTELISANGDAMVLSTLVVHFSLANREYCLPRELPMGFPFLASGETPVGARFRFLIQPIIEPKDPRHPVTCHLVAAWDAYEKLVFDERGQRGTSPTTTPEASATPAPATQGDADGWGKMDRDRELSLVLSPSAAQFKLGQDIRFDLTVRNLNSAERKICLRYPYGFEWMGKLMVEVRDSDRRLVWPRDNEGNYESPWQATWEVLPPRGKLTHSGRLQDIYDIEKPGVYWLRALAYADGRQNEMVVGPWTEITVSPSSQPAEPAANPAPPTTQRGDSGRR